LPEPKSVLEATLNKELEPWLTDELMNSVENALNFQVVEDSADAAASVVMVDV
jgi:hypothetical protein